MGPQRQVAGLGNAVSSGDLLCHRLVHRHSRAQHASTDVRHVGQLEHALHRAVLAERPVQQRHDNCAPAADRKAAGSGGEGRGRGHGLTRRIQAAGQRVRPFGQRRQRTGGDRPRAVAGDADGRDPILRRIGSAQHVCGGGAADVVLGRLPAELLDQVDAIVVGRCGVGPCRCGGECVGSHATPTVPCAAMRFRAEMVAAVTGGRLHGPDVPIDGVSFDSRSIQPGQLFVPLFFR